MVAATRMIWLCTCTRYWRGRGLMYVCPLFKFVLISENVIFDVKNYVILSLITYARLLIEIPFLQ